MKENIVKVSKFVLLIVAVVVVCILLFRQCSGGKSSKETSIDNSVPMTSVKKENIEEAVKLNSTESQEKRTEVIAEGLIDNKDVVSKATKKLDATSFQVKKIHKPVVQKGYQVSGAKQFDKNYREDGKPKLVEVLKNELKVLEVKVSILEDKVKALLEKMRLFSEEKEDGILAEELVKKEKEVNSTNTIETAKDDAGLIYRYPTHVLAGGLSTYEKWTGYGLQASYTYRINKFISLGGQGNAFLKEGKYEGDRDLYMGIRANFHIFPLFVENSRFDLYAGGTGGIGRDDDVEVFETMWCLGSSYDFSKRWGVFIEAGSIGVMGLRLTF